MTTPRTNIDIEACDECGNHFAVDKLAMIWEGGQHLLMCERCVDELRLRLMEVWE
jgi:hypothetical protein